MLSQSTSVSNDEKRRFTTCMTVDYMSSEDNTSGDDSSGDEDAPKRKVLCRRPLAWRSENLNSLFARLYRKNKRSESMMMKRKDGSPSEREAPDDAPEFALL